MGEAKAETIPSAEVETANLGGTHSLSGCSEIPMLGVPCQLTVTRMSPMRVEDLSLRD